MLETCLAEQQNRRGIHVATTAISAYHAVIAVKVHPGFAGHGGGALSKMDDSGWLNRFRKSGIEAAARKYGDDGFIVGSH